MDIGEDRKAAGATARVLCGGMAVLYRLTTKSRHHFSSCSSNTVVSCGDLRISSFFQSKRRGSMYDLPTECVGKTSGFTAKNFTDQTYCHLRPGVGH